MDLVQASSQMVFVVQPVNSSWIRCFTSDEDSPLSASTTASFSVFNKVWVFSRSKVSSMEIFDQLHTHYIRLYFRNKIRLPREHHFYGRDLGCLGNVLRCQAVSQVWSSLRMVSLPTPSNVIHRVYAFNWQANCLAPLSRHQAWWI